MAPVKLEPQDTVFAVSQAILTVLKHSRNANFIENTLATLQVNTLQEAERRLALQLWLILHRQLGADIPSEITEEITSQNFQEGKIHCLSSTYECFGVDGEQGQDIFPEDINFDETGRCQGSYSMLISPECNGTSPILHQSYYPLPSEFEKSQRFSLLDITDDTSDSRVSVHCVTSTPVCHQQSYSASKNKNVSIGSSPTKKVSEAFGHSSDMEFLRNVSNHRLGETQEPKLDWGSMPSLSIEESTILDQSLKFPSYSCLEKSQLLANNDICDDFSPNDDYRNGENCNSKNNIAYRIDKAMTMLVENAHLQGPNESQEGNFNQHECDISCTLFEDIAQETGMGHKIGDKHEVEERVLKNLSNVPKTKSCSPGQSKSLKESVESETVNQSEGTDGDILTLKDNAAGEKSQTSNRHRENFSCSELLDLAISKLSKTSYPTEKLYDEPLQCSSKCTEMESKALKQDILHHFSRSGRVEIDDCPPAKTFRSISNNSPDKWLNLQEDNIVNNQVPLEFGTPEQEICYKTGSVVSPLNPSTEAAESIECLRLALNTYSPNQLKQNENHKKSSDIESDQFTVSERDFDSDFNISKSFEEDDNEHLSFSFDVETKKLFMKTVPVNKQYDTNKEHDASNEMNEQYQVELAREKNCSVKETGDQEDEYIHTLQSNETYGAKDGTIDDTHLEPFQNAKYLTKLNLSLVKERQTPHSKEDSCSNTKTSSVSIMQSSLVGERIHANPNTKPSLQSSDTHIIKCDEASLNISELPSYESVLSLQPSPRDKEANASEDYKFNTLYSNDDILRDGNPIKRPVSALSYVSELSRYESLNALLASPGNIERKSDDENEHYDDDLPDMSLQARSPMKHSAVSLNVSDLPWNESLTAFLSFPGKTESNCPADYEQIIGISKAVNLMDQSAAATRNVSELPSYDSDIALLPCSSHKARKSQVENELTDNKTHDNIFSDLNATDQSVATLSPVSELPSYDSLFAVVPSTRVTKESARDENGSIFKRSQDDDCKDITKTSARLSEVRTCELPPKAHPGNNSPNKETSTKSFCSLSDALVMGDYVQISHSDSDVSEKDLTSCTFDILDISTLDDDSFNSENTSDESKKLRTLVGSSTPDDKHKVSQEASLLSSLLPEKPLMTSTPHEKVPPEPTRQLALSSGEPHLIVQNVETLIDSDEVIEETPPRVMLKDYLVQGDNRYNQCKPSRQSGNDTWSDEENNSESLLKGMSLEAMYAASHDLGCEPFDELPSTAKTAISDSKNNLHRNEDGALQHSLTYLLNSTDKMCNLLPDYILESSLFNKKKENFDKVPNSEYNTSMNLKQSTIYKIPESHSERGMLKSECKADVNHACLKETHSPDVQLVRDTDLSRNGKVSMISVPGNYITIQDLHPEVGSPTFSHNETNIDSKSSLNVRNHYFTEQEKKVTSTDLHRDSDTFESEVPQSKYAAQENCTCNTDTNLQNLELQISSPVLESYYLSSLNVLPSKNNGRKSNESSVDNICILSQNYENLQSYQETSKKNAGCYENESEFSVKSNQRVCQEYVQPPKAPSAHEPKSLEERSSLEFTLTKNKRASAARQLCNYYNPETTQDEDKPQRNTEVNLDTQDDNHSKEFSIFEQINVIKSLEEDITHHSKEFSHVNNQRSVYNTEPSQTSSLDFKQTHLTLQENSKNTERHEQNSSAPKITKVSFDDQFKNQQTKSLCNNEENPDKESTSGSQSVKMDKEFLENLVSEYFPVQFFQFTDFLDDISRNEYPGSVFEEINSEELVSGNEIELILSEMEAAEVINNARSTQRGELITEALKNANNSVCASDQTMCILYSNKNTNNAQEVTMNFPEQQNRKLQSPKESRETASFKTCLNYNTITCKDETPQMLRPKGINTSAEFRQNISQQSQEETQNILKINDNYRAVTNDKDKKSKSEAHIDKDAIFLQSIRNKYSTQQNEKKISIPTKPEICNKQVSTSYEKARQQQEGILLSRDNEVIDETRVLYNELSMMSVEEYEDMGATLRSNELKDFQIEDMECEYNMGHPVVAGNFIMQEVVESRMSVSTQINEVEQMIWEEQFDSFMKN